MSWKIHLEPLIRFGLPGYRMYVTRQQTIGGDKFSIVRPPLTLQDRDANAFMVPEDALLDDSVHYTGLAGSYHDVRGFLQAMSDAAWEIGIKPRGLEGHTDELRAVRYHLEDMRQLAGVKK